MASWLSAVKTTPGSNSWIGRHHRDLQVEILLSKQCAYLLEPPGARHCSSQEPSRLPRGNLQLGPNKLTGMRASSAELSSSPASPAFGSAVTVRACLLGVMGGGRSVLLSLRTRLHGEVLYPHMRAFAGAESHLPQRPSNHISDPFPQQPTACDRKVLSRA